MLMRLHTAQRAGPNVASRNLHKHRVQPTLRVCWRGSVSRLSKRNSAKVRKGMCHAQSVTAKMDMKVMVKLSVARSSGKLDLSNCGLAEVPEELCSIIDLEDLSLAGNQLTKLPDNIGNLRYLKRLQLAGNLLTCLPDSLCSLTALQGLWVHGNVLTHLPDNFGQLTELRTISLAGNCITALPPSISGLVQLQDLGLQGNQLTQLPAELGTMSALQKLTINGNKLSRLPPEIGQLSALEDLQVQGNELTRLPDQICNMQALQSLNMADNKLERLPTQLSCLTSLRQLWAYGNQIQALLPDILSLPGIKNIWIEANPMHATALQSLLQQLAARPPPELRELGLDQRQVEHIKPSILAAAEGVKVAQIRASGRGYFKLVDGTSQHSLIAENGTQGQRTLVVTFASAPGLPNWGGLLRKVHERMTDPAHKCFDTLYVVDPSRTWYQGGNDGFQYWEDRLRQITQRYSRVVMLGDSMGATAALLFSSLATAVQVFSPQVDLTVSSIRPGITASEMAVLKDRLLQKVASSQAAITVHVSSWEHDTEQGQLLPSEKVDLKKYKFADHRLAFWLDGKDLLEPLLRHTILVQQGFTSEQAAESQQQTERVHSNVQLV